MTVQTVTPETLPVLTWNNQPVITTELLAQIYGAKVIQIRQNFKNNVSRFIEGVHYFLLKGTDLKEFKNRVDNIDSVEVGKNANALMLWTERGTVRHAKILDTDKAWEVQDRLEDCYFTKHQKPYGLKQLPPSPYITGHEAQQFKKSLEAHCKGNSDLYRKLYHKVWEHYGMESYKMIPAGKLCEAAQVAGIKLVPLFKAKLKPEQQQVIMTKSELLAHDEQVKAEAVKSVQGELVNSPTLQDGSITISFKQLGVNELRRTITMQSMGMVSINEISNTAMFGEFDELVYKFNDMGFLVIEKSKLESSTLKQLCKLIA